MLDGELRILIAYLLFLLVLSVLPLFDSRTYCFGFESDEAEHLLTAREISNGKVLYDTILAHKLPVLYLALVPIVKTCGSGILCTRMFSVAINFLIAIIVFLTCKKYLSGFAKYIPAIIYLVYSYASMNIFFRAEFIASLLWAFAFYFLVSLQKTNFKRNLALTGFFLIASSFTKPTAAFGLSLPVLYLLWHERRKREFIFFFGLGMAFAAVVFGGFFLFGTKWTGYLTAGYDLGFDAYFRMLLSERHIQDVIISIGFCFVLFFPMIIGLANKNLIKSRFGALSFLFFLSVLFIILLKLYSVWIYPLVMYSLILPFSFLIGIVSDSFRGIRRLKGVLLILLAIMIFAVAFSVILAWSSYSDYVGKKLALSTSGCSGIGAIVERIRWVMKEESKFFVFPTGAEYYLMLNKSPLVRALYYYIQIPSPYYPSGPTLIDSWYSKEVFGPVMKAKPDIVVLVNESFDHTRNLDMEDLEKEFPSFAQFRKFLGENYINESVYGSSWVVWIYKKK
ncbi:MAG: glycosyltransferase family 39 protein [Candidatus Anstonellales archaeon]